MSKPVFMIVLTLMMSASRPAAAGRWSHFLPTEDVRRIQYDSLNKIYWFGTDNNGLWRFDGRQFEHFSQTPDGRSINHVTALAIDDKDAVLWVGTTNGLFRFHFNANAWEYFDQNSGLSKNSITALFVDHRSILWYGCKDDRGVGGGIGKRDSTGWYRYTTSNYPEKPPGYAKWMPDSGWVSIPGVESIPGTATARNLVISIAQDQQGKLYFGSQGVGLCILDMTTTSWDNCFIAFPSPPTFYRYIQAIAIDREGNKWLGTREGVCRLNRTNDTLVCYTPSNSMLVEKTVHAIWIEAYHDGEIKWFGTSGGVSVLDSTNQRWNIFTNENSDLGSNEVRDIIGDGDGNLWFASLQARGVSKLDHNWTELKTKDGLSSNFTLAVAKDRRGHLWVGTDFGGVEILSGGKWIRPTLESCENLPLVTEFLPEGEAMWVASQCGIFKFAPDLSVQCRIAENSLPGFPSNDVRAIAVRNDTLWAGTHRAGLARVLNCNTAARPDRFFLPDHQITALAYTSYGQLWAGTNHGLYVFNGTQFLLTPIPVFNSQFAINALARDSTDAMWVGTDLGIAHFEGVKWTRFSTVDGLPDERINAVEVAPDGTVWCGTVNGAAVFVDGSWVAYTTNTTDGGLSDDLISDIAFGPEDVIWFATYGGGISRYRRNNVAPQTYLFESFKIVTETNAPFRYSGYDSKTDSVDLRFQYALDDPSRWFFAPSNNVTLSIQEDGLHTFYVRAIDEDGNVDASPAKLRFHKMSPRQGRAVTIVDSTLGPKLDSLSLYVPPAVLPEGSSIRVNPVVVDANEIANSNRHLRFTGIAFALVLQPENISLATNTRPITLKIFYNDSVTQKFARNELAIYQQEEGEWIRRGGHADATKRVITTTIAQLDTFALFEDSEIAANALALADLGSLAVQPRMLSPEFAEKVTVSFDLSKPTEVTAKVYNLAGRLVRVLCENHPMNSGRNTVEWNGSDYNGKRCSSGMYLICVQANGRTATKTVMVVNR